MKLSFVHGFVYFSKTEKSRHVAESRPVFEGF